ncbi:MAG: peroxide stress protein YaaA [Nocardioides sp.]|uniref:peroxide stress protein YaaA n=1 Tax=Nocardioides sp. TaxID=35761 RepID=UPI003EFD64AF
MLILLPPSEGKSVPARGKPLDLSALGSPSLTPARERVLDALVALSDSPDAADVLGLGATQAHLVDLNAELRTAPTARAESIYTGVLYDALDLPTLSTAARRRATTRVAVVSSLFGLVRPGDRIPSYRLSGDVSLPGIGPVAGVWREAFGGAVTDALGTGLLVDLRSTTYANFWRPDADVARRTATVRVLHEVGGKRKVVSHFNKATKGRIVRALMEDGANPRTVPALADALGALGWKVEMGTATPKGTQLDVVVTDL